MEFCTLRSESMIERKEDAEKYVPLVQTEFSLYYGDAEFEILLPEYAVEKLCELVAQSSFVDCFSNLTFKFL